MIALLTIFFTCAPSRSNQLLLPIADAEDAHAIVRTAAVTACRVGRQIEKAPSDKCRKGLFEGFRLVEVHSAEC